MKKNRLNKHYKTLDQILETGSKAEIRALFEFDSSDTVDDIYIKYNLWARWFFPKFFTSSEADFHKVMDRKRIRLYLGLDSSFLNIAFRDSAKTTKAKIFRAYVIANDSEHRRKYFRILSKDVGNAKQSVTDIYNMLIAKRVKEYYPEIFAKSDTKREETMSSFTTSTGVKVVSDTVGTDQRGALQDESRPDFDWYDDFETRLSLTSAVTTEKIWQNMEEARTGLAKDGVSEYTCNYISERGNVHKLVEKIENQMITPIEINGVPTWNRFSEDDLIRIRKETDDYAGEYLCMPSASKDVYFDRASLDRQEAKTPIDEIAGLKIYKKYNPMNRISSGHDVGGGVGLDHSTSVFLDLDCMPVQVVATYKNNEIKPDAFAHIIHNQAKRFGENYVAVEKNYGSTLDILKSIYPTDKLHRTYNPKVKIVYSLPTEFGWSTNSATKPAMLADLGKAVEDGLIELNDKDLIQELRSYTIGDLMDREVDPRLTTRHFDLLMACAIAWAVRNHVKAPVRPEDVYDRINRARSRQKTNPAR